MNDLAPVFVLIILSYFIISFIDYDNKTRLQKFYVCKPNNQTLSQLPIMDKYQYKRFQNEHSDMFKSYSCSQKLYTQDKVNKFNN